MLLLIYNKKVRPRKLQHSQDTQIATWETIAYIICVKSKEHVCYKYHQQENCSSMSKNMIKLEQESCSSKSWNISCSAHLNILRCFPAVFQLENFSFLHLDSCSSTAGLFRTGLYYHDSCHIHARYMICWSGEDIPP